MKIIKKLVKSIVVTTLIICMSVMPVYAAENQNLIVSEEAENSAVMPTASSTVVAPDGKVYTYLATIDRNYQWKGMLQQTIAARDDVQLKFYCPNNNNLSLVQGSIEARESVGTNVKNYSFLNRYSEISTIDLSTLPGYGRYIIRITLNSIGTNPCTVYYRTE